MRRRAIAVLLALLSSAPAHADMPVIDAANLFKWFQQAQDMARTIAQLEATVRSLTNVPQDLLQQVQGLLQQGAQNPLGNITQNLQVLLAGRGTGNCNGSQQFLTQNQYTATTGTDFTSQWMSQSQVRNAGIQACTQQMLVATQTRLDQMPGLLTELQNAKDVTQVSAVQARIQYETSTIAAQQQQASLIAQMAMTKRAMAEDTMMQKMRSDAREIINNTQPGGLTGNATAPMAALPPPTPFGGGG